MCLIVHDLMPWHENGLENTQCYDCSASTAGWHTFCDFPLSSMTCAVQPQTSRNFQRASGFPPLVIRVYSIPSKQPAPHVSFTVQLRLLVSWSLAIVRPIWNPYNCTCCWYWIEAWRRRCNARRRLDSLRHGMITNPGDYLIQWTNRICHIHI